jgi:outer membrane immunogenic protein
MSTKIPKTSAVFALALTMTISPADAGKFDFLWPATDAELGKISWTGFIVNPDLGPDKMKFSGTGGNQLKKAKGFHGGAELGYDYQIGGIVVGVAGELYGSSLKGDAATGREDRLHSRVDYFGTFRGRLGYAADRWLVFGTGGFAFSRLEIENKALRLSDKQDLNGWVAGGGVEYVYNKSITLRAEYTRLEFKDKTFSSLPVGQREVGSTMDLVKLGVIKRF